MRGTEPRVRDERGKDAQRAKSVAGKNSHTISSNDSVFVSNRNLLNHGVISQKATVFLSEKPSRKCSQKPNVFLSRTKRLWADIILSSIRDSMFSYLPLYVELTLPISLHHSFLDFGTYQTLTWLLQVLVSYFPKNKILLLRSQVMKWKNVPHYSNKSIQDTIII